jgi:hypothetical protein
VPHNDVENTPFPLCLAAQMYSNPQAVAQGLVVKSKHASLRREIAEIPCAASVLSSAADYVKLRSMLQMLFPNEGHMLSV